MKNKQTTYLLILGFIAIWAVVGYQIISNLDDDNEVILSTNQQYTFAETDSVIDTFLLIADYRDPFLGTYQKQKKVIINNSSPTLNQTPKIPVVEDEEKTDAPPVILGNIQYYGIIQNESNSNAIGILYIDNEEYAVSKGMEVKGYTVSNLLEDEIELKHQEEIFTFKRN